MRKIILVLLTLAGQLPILAQKGYISVEQPVRSGEDTISGTLLTPFNLSEKSKIKNTPLVIIIPGSGPTDRDGNFNLAPGKNDSYKQLADSLLKQGVASYRYDKPGVGESVMKRGESELRFDDNVDVVLSVIDHFHSELGFREFYLLGHSEGSLVGMLAAQKSKKVNGLISVAGPANNALDLLRVQLESALKDTVLLQQAMQKLDSIKSGHQVSGPRSLMSLLRPSVQPYLRSWFAYTPAEELGKVKQPVLIIQGGRDLQVPIEEANSLRKAQPDATYMFFPEMNHVMKVVDDSPEQNRAAYMDEDFRLPDDYAGKIADWIKEQ